MLEFCKRFFSFPFIIDFTAQGFGHLEFKVAL